MQKKQSVFVQYFLSFFIIILASFLMLLAILTSIITNYSFKVKKEIMYQTADSATSCVNELIALLDTESGEETVMSDKTRHTLYILLEALVTNSDGIHIKLADAEGQVFLHVGNTSGGILSNETIPEEIRKIADEEGRYSNVRSSQRWQTRSPLQLVVPFSHPDEHLTGYIMVTSESALWGDLLSSTVRGIVLTTLFILLVALIAVYIISERVSQPLRQMSQIVHKYGSGDFSQRVPVKGNNEIAQLAVAFNSMADSMESLEKLRNGFVANVSHDLRTPMTTIIGFIDGIRDGVIPPDKQEYYLGIVSAEAQRLSRLVSSLLDISKMEAGEREYKMKPVDICEMARQILISFEQKINQKQLDVEFECFKESVKVEADYDAIYQTLYNLCDNALKFSPEKGKYAIRIREDRENPQKVVVTVYNEGKGIAQEDLPFVFERFYKTDRSRSQDKTGLGLGLYIAKTIVEAHGEKIWVQSTENEYCEFGFTLRKTD